MLDLPLQRRVVLLAHEHMNVLDLTGPLQAFHTANRFRPAGTAPYYDLVVASERGGLITTSAGLPVMTQSLAHLDGEAIDTLLAPGGCRDDIYEVSPAVADGCLATPRGAVVSARFARVHSCSPQPESSTVAAPPRTGNGPTDWPNSILPFMWIPKAFL